MATLTIEQKNAIHGLREFHGEEAQLSIERSTAPYGLVRIRWIEGPAKVREVYILPDGEILHWENLESDL
jgi:hypothetical protein